MDRSSSLVPTWLQELPKEFLWLVTYACLFQVMHTCRAILGFFSQLYYQLVAGWVGLPTNCNFQLWILLG